MSVSQQDVVDYIKNLKLSEVKALIDILEDELGVEASAPVAVAAVGGAAGGAAAAEEKTEFDVVMKSFGEKKMLETARNLVVKEIAVARSKSEESTQAEIEQIFEKN